METRKRMVAEIQYTQATKKQKIQFHMTNHPPYPCFSSTLCKGRVNLEPNYEYMSFIQSASALFLEHDASTTGEPERKKWKKKIPDMGRGGDCFGLY